MESFFISETAKYLYLLFHGSPALIDFFVLTTEGHPLTVLHGGDGGVPEADARAEAEARADASAHAMAACALPCRGPHTEAELAKEVRCAPWLELCARCGACA